MEPTARPTAGPPIPMPPQTSPPMASIPLQTPPPMASIPPQTPPPMLPTPSPPMPPTPMPPMARPTAGPTACDKDKPIYKVLKLQNCSWGPILTGMFPITKIRLRNYMVC